MAGPPAGGTLDVRDMRACDAGSPECTSNAIAAGNQITSVRWSSGRLSTRTQCGEVTPAWRVRSVGGTNVSISVACATCSGDGATWGRSIRSIGVGAVGRQQVTAAVCWQHAICLMQCVVRSADGHAAPGNAMTTASIALITCFAQALMDIRRRVEQGTCQTGPCGIAGRFAGNVADAPDDPAGPRGFSGPVAGIPPVPGGRFATSSGWRCGRWCRRCRESRCRCARRVLPRCAWQSASRVPCRGAWW